MNKYCKVLPVQELLYEQRMVGLGRDHPESIRKASEFKGFLQWKGCVCVCVCVCVFAHVHGRQGGEGHCIRKECPGMNM